MQASTKLYSCVNCGERYTSFHLYCNKCGCVMPDALNDDSERTRLLEDIHAQPVSSTWGKSYFHRSARLQFRVEETDEIILARFNNPPALIGRTIASYTPHICIPKELAVSSGVSRLHARIDQIAARLFITDMGSTNGTFLDGQALTPSTTYPLHNGATLQLGTLVLRVEYV
ncbi:MAG TPA: FHA domain-containing protein [Aggregatilineales bacterium]|nr:FHA domain-containing protein [Aggregatilineales bacterium]